METTLTDLQKQVDALIEARLQRICMAEWRKAQTIMSGPRKGRLRIRFVQVTYPAVVNALLSLRQELYAGVDPERIAAAVTSGEIQNSFLHAN